MSTDRRREELRNLIKRLGIYNVSELTGMKIYELAIVSKLSFDYKTANEILWSLIYNDKLPKNYQGFEISLDEFGGAYYWNYEKTTRYYGPPLKEKIYALATPFWDANPYIPIDIEYYEVYTLNGIKIIEKNPQIFSMIQPIKEWFNSVEELIIWYKEFYLEKVYTEIMEGVNVIRKDSKSKIIR